MISLFLSLTLAVQPPPTPPPQPHKPDRRDASTVVLGGITNASILTQPDKPIGNTIMTEPTKTFQITEINEGNCPECGRNIRNLEETWTQIEELAEERAAEASQE